MTISILGGGAFGTALAIDFAHQGHAVTLWARDTNAHMTLRQSPRLPGFTIPDTVTITNDLHRACQNDTLFLAVPTQQLGAVLRQVSVPMAGTRLIACCKGLDVDTLQGPTAICAAIKPHAKPAVLSGPSFAVDIASQDRPVALTLACRDEHTALALQKTFSHRRLRLYRSTDVTGVELGGALKNVIAIACGACVGLGLGESAKAAVMSRGFAEIARFAARNGAALETLYGLSGLGDLALTCGSEQSRNYRYGLALGRDAAFDAKTTVEGVKTASAIVKLAHSLQIEMPICAMVNEVNGGKSSLADALAALLDRPLKEE